MVATAASVNISDVFVGGEFPSAPPATAAAACAPKPAACALPVEIVVAEVDQAVPFQSNISVLYEGGFAGCPDIILAPPTVPL